MKKRKKSLRKVPLFIEARLSIIGNEFYVAVVKRIPTKDVEAGHFKHVGVTWQNGQASIAQPSIISPEFGRFARLNIEGQEIVRRDLPKVDKVITFINPRLFGIPGNSCRITQVRKVNQREQLPGRRLEIEPSILLAGSDSLIVRFSIKRKFTSLDPNIDRELLFALNLLQEAVGSINVFSNTATPQDYLSTVHVQWEILPSGQRDSNLQLILSSFRPRTPEERAELEKRATERYDFFETLNPKHIIRGTGGLDGYMGALIDEEMVVFEHLSPGNGIYILFADWAEQSQRTKTDLLTYGEEGKDYVRITHTGDWQLRVRNEIASRA